MKNKLPEKQNVKFYFLFLLFWGAGMIIPSIIHTLNYIDEKSSLIAGVVWGVFFPLIVSCAMNTQHLGFSKIDNSKNEK